VSDELVTELGFNHVTYLSLPHTECRNLAGPRSTMALGFEALRIAGRFSPSRRLIHGCDVQSIDGWFVAMASAASCHVWVRLQGWFTGRWPAWPRP
jgi:hypothetical protein